MGNVGVGFSLGGNRMEKLIMFHGRECPHCKNMMPYVDKLEEETGIQLEKLEVWHDEKNADLILSHLSVEDSFGLRLSSTQKPMMSYVERWSTRNSKSGPQNSQYIRT